jgi:hypothetical protein
MIKTNHHLSSWFIMNPFPSSIPYFILAILFLLPACEDRALLKKDEELNQYIKELKKEIEFLQADAGKNPGDQSQMIASFSEILDKAKTEKKNLENQKDILERDHAKMESQYSDYKKSYPIKK